MAISLQKGQKISLDKGLTLVKIGLGWDVNKYDGQVSFDLDASAFLLGANGKVRKDSDFVFYNNDKSENNAIIYGGDNRTGSGNGDDETIMIDFSKVPNDVEKITITATIYNAKKLHQNFGMVENAYIRLCEMEDNQTEGTEVLRYDLGEDFSIETAVVFAELYKRNGQWKFSAIGSGYQGGLAALGRSYGLDVEEEH